MDRSLLSVAIVVCLLALAGVLGGAFFMNRQRTLALELARAERAEAEMLRKELVTRLAEAEEARASAEERARKLEREVTDLAAEVERRAGGGAARPDADGKGDDAGAATDEREKKAPIAAGKWGELEAVGAADWDEMGGAVAAMNELLVELLEAIENGETPDVALQEKIRDENNKLLAYAVGIMGKVPSHSPMNGEFSHPLTTANLVSAMLEGTDLPLTEHQKTAIGQLGEEYERLYDEMQAGYGDGTSRLRKLMDELELKRDTTDSMERLLSAEQRDLVLRPEIHHRQSLDPLSPFTAGGMFARSKTVGSPEEFRGMVNEYVSEKLGIGEDGAASIAPVIDAWMRDLEPILSPVDRAEKFVTLDRALVAGQAQAAAMDRLLRLPELDDKQRSALLAELAWLVPQVVEGRASAEGGASSGAGNE